MTGSDVSVIIPAYQAGRTITRAVDSLLGQTTAPGEILIVDDGSTDDLVAVLAVYGDRVTLVRKCNGGAASARNAGIELARGRFIAFLDADDYWLPWKLERQLEVFRRHPEVGLVAGQFFEEPPGGSRFITQHGWKVTWQLYENVLRLSGANAFAAAMRVWTGVVIVRRETLGELRFFTGLEQAQDRDLWVRLVAAAPVYLLSEPLAVAVLEPGSLSRLSADRGYANMLQVVHRNTSLLGRSGVRRWEARVFQRWAASRLAGKDPGSALRPAWERLKRQPYSSQAWWVFLKSAALAIGMSKGRKWGRIARI